VPRDFYFGFLHEPHSHGPLISSEKPFRTFPAFYKDTPDSRQLDDAPALTKTGGHILFVIYIDSGDTDGKFFTGVNDVGDHLPPVSTKHLETNIGE
jgi:hypothetical protein